MSEPGNGENPPRNDEQPSYPPPPTWQPPVYLPPNFQEPGHQQPGQQQPGYPTYPPPGYQQPGYPTYPPPGYAQPGYPPQPPQYGPPGYSGGYGFRPPPAPVPGGRLAGMGARFGGLVVDAIVLAVPFLIIAAYAGAFHRTTTCDVVSGTCTRGIDVVSTLALDFVGLLVGVAYSALLVGLQGQTVGHRVAGIRVVDATTGRVIGPGRAAVRWLVMGVTGAFCTLGYWSPFFDSARRQGWHDKSVNSVVIPAH